MTPTNQPVRFLGPYRFRKMRILSLAFIQAEARAEMEIDLASLPPLISGGDRKARAKAIAEQRSEFNAPRRIEDDFYDDAGYDSWVYACPRCRHMMFLDLTDEELAAFNMNTFKCDRCQSVGGKPPPSRWERVLG